MSNKFLTKNKLKIHVSVFMVSIQHAGEGKYIPFFQRLCNILPQINGNYP